MKRFLILMGFLASPVSGMGRLPSDPATWGDVQGVQTQVATNASKEEADTVRTNNRIDEIEALKLQLGVTARLYDGRYTSLNVFGLKDIQGTGGDAVGLSIGLKLGKSYEQRLLEKQQKQIDFLLQHITHEVR